MAIVPASFCADPSSANTFTIEQPSAPNDQSRKPDNQSVCNKLHALFARIRQRVTYTKTARQVPIATEAGKVAISIIKSPLFIQGLQAFLRKPDEASVNDWMANTKVMKTVGSLRLCVAVAMVVSTYLIIEQGIEIRDEIIKGRWREGIDAVLRLVDATGVLADSTASFTIGLSMVGAVKASQILWVTPLAMVAAALATATVALEARGWHQSNQILKMLESNNKKNESEKRKIANKWNAIDVQEQRLKSKKENFEGEADRIIPLDFRLRWLYEELTNETRDGDFFLRRHFEVINREKYTAQILSIILEENNDASKLSPRQNQLLSALYARIDDKIGSHKLGLISAIISIIGLVILFIPGAPMVSGVALLGFAAVLGTIRFVWDYKSVRRLEKRLDKEADFNKIPPQWLIDHSPQWRKKHARHAIL